MTEVLLGTQSVFSGSYSLTTSLASTGASAYTLNPSDWPLPSGYTRRQYRYTFQFATNPSDTTQYCEAWERRTAGTPVYHLGGAVNRSGWADASGWANDLRTVGSVSTATSPGAAFGNALSLAGSGNLISSEIHNFGAFAKPFCFECMFSRSRVFAGVETILGIWQTSPGLFVAYFNNNVLTVTNGTGTVANGSSTGTGGTHWFAYSWDGTTARAYLDGTRFMNQTHTPGSAAQQMEIGANAAGNRFQGLIDEVRLSLFTPRYTGASYAVPTAPFARDGYCFGLYHLNTVQTNTPTVVTDWAEFPSVATACDLYARNRDANGNSLTSASYEVRAVS